MTSTTAILPAQIHLPGSATWFACSRLQPDLLSGLTAGSCRFLIFRHDAVFSGMEVAGICWRYLYVASIEHARCGGRSDINFGAAVVFTPTTLQYKFLLHSTQRVRFSWICNSWSTCHRSWPHNIITLLSPVSKPCDNMISSSLFPFLK